MAFAVGNLEPAPHLYPPLYDLLVTPFYLLFRSHPHFVPDGLLLLVATYALITIGRRLYGWWVAPVVLALMIACLPYLTIQQWVIPWTTSLQTALVSVLFLIYFRLEVRDRPFVVQTRADHALFAAFFLVYGALVPTRPLDIFVFLPFAVAFFLRALIATARSCPGGQRGSTMIRMTLLAGACGAIFVAFYLGFNAYVFKNILGRYVDAVAVYRYDISTVPMKVYSIFWESGVVYGETMQAFFERVPLLAPAMAISIVTAWLYSGLRRWIVISALLQFLLYFPYGDLLPTGVFRYFNLHYFKWTYPWFFLIAAGQLLIWARSLSTGWKPMAASAGIVVIGAMVSVVPVKIDTASDVRDTAAGTVAIDLNNERTVDYIDLPGISGGFPSVYLGSHTATVDGPRNFNRREFRLLPISMGVRMLFARPTPVQSIDLKVGPNVTVGEGTGQVTAYRLQFSIGCRFRRCGDQG